MGANGRSHPPTFRERRRAAAAEALLAAAEAVIGEKGYDHATMQDIAARAGCAAGTLYLYFKNKEQLFHAMVARHSRAVSAQMGAALDAAAPPLERLRRSFEVLLDYFGQHQSFFRVYYTAEPGGRATLTAGLGARAMKDYLAYRARELDVVRAAAAAGALRRDFTPEELLDFMHGLTFSTLARWTVGPAPRRAEQMRLLWGFLLGGLTGEGPRP